MAETLAPDAPLSFAELTQLHDRLKSKSPFFAGQDLPQFSKFVNDSTGSQIADQGLQDSHIKRASLAIDRFLRPASEAAGEAMGNLAETVGLGQYSDLVRQVGEALPRSAAETLPIIAGGALLAAPDPTLITKAAGLGLIGAGASSAGAKTYEETGSGLAGLISGGAMAAMPAAGRLGSKLIGEPLINKFLMTGTEHAIGKAGGVATTLAPRFTQANSGRLVSEAAKIAESGLSSLGANIGVTVLNEAAGQAASAAAGQGLYNPITEQHAVELAAGTLPFAAIDAAMHLHGRLTKNFTSQTSVDNAQYLGRVVEAQQLAETADLINKFRKTEMLSKPRLGLPYPEGPEPIGEGPRKQFAGPDELGTAFPKEGVIPPPTSSTGMGETSLKQTLSNVEKQLWDVPTIREREFAELNRQVKEGVLTPEEAAQRAANVAKLPTVEEPPVAAPTPTPTAAAAPIPNAPIPAGMDINQTQMEKNAAARASSTMGSEMGKTAEATLQQGASSFNAMLGAREYFARRFKTMGLEDSDVKMYTDIAEKIAAAYSDVGHTRIVEAVGMKARGIHLRSTDEGDGLNNLIGLQDMNEFKRKDMVIFKALHTGAHELWHAMQDGARNDILEPIKRDRLEKLERQAASMTSDERRDMMDHVWNMMIPKEYLKSDSLRNKFRNRSNTDAADHKEFMADMAGVYALGLIRPDNESHLRYIREEMKFSSPLEQQFAKAFYTPMRDILQATTDFMKHENEMGKPNGPARANKLKMLASLTSDFEALLKDSEHIKKAQDALASIEANDPALFEKLRAEGLAGKTVEKDLTSYIRSGDADEEAPFLKKAVHEASKYLGLAHRAELEKELGVHPRFLERWFYPFAQLSAAYPQLLGIHNITRSYTAVANDYLVQLMAPFLGKANKLGNLSIDENAHGLRAVARNPVEQDALNKVRLISNEVSKAEKRELTDEEVRQALPPGLSTEAARRVTDLFRTLTREVYPEAARIQVAAAAQSVSHATAAVLMARNKSIKWRDALALGTWIRDAVIAQSDPLKAAEVQQKMAMVQQQVGPLAAESGVKMATALLEKVQHLEKLFSENPGYSPETRLGKYLVLWRREGSRDWGSFASDDFTAAKAKLDEMRAVVGEKGSATMRDKYDKARMTAGMDPDLVARYASIDNAAFQAALKELGDDTDELKKFRSLYSPGEAVATEVKSRSLQQFLLPRKLAEGREDTNAILGMLNYVSGVAHGLAKGYTREQAGLAFMDPELRLNPKLKDLGEKHLQNVINPSAAEFTGLKQLNFAYFLGFNFSSMLIEGSQGVMTLVPQLTRDTGSISAGYKAYGSAVKTFVEGLTSKDRKLKDPDLQAAMSRAVKEGRVDAGFMQEFNTLEENLLPNLHALASNSKLVEAKEMITKPLYWYLHAARWLYSHAPRANSHVAFIAAYDVARSKLGLKGDQAYNYAITTVDRTMFGGGKAGRPVEMFADTGKAQGVVGLMYSLQTYTFSTLAMMARLGKDSITQSDRLSTAEKRAARKAFGQMMVTQVAMGGALSLPFASGILAVIDQFFPEAEARKKTREAFHSLLDNNGLFSGLADVALKGLPDAAGVDLSSRVGLSSMLGVNPYTGFQLGNLVGPTGSVVENTLRAARSATVGEYGNAAQTLLPSSYRNVLQLYQDNGEVKDREGKLLYQPSDLEKAAMLVGFRPKSVTSRQEASQLIAQTEEVERARLARFHKEQTDLLLAGQPGEVRKNLLNYAAANHMYDPRAGARRVVEMAQAATVPNDVARTGGRTSAQERQRIATMQSQAPGPTEVQLLQQRKSLERTLQIPGAGQLSPSEVVIARTTDYLMQMDRTLGRQEARVRAERLLGRGGHGPRL